MRVALTGTPGTGKTAVATVLRNQGYSIVELHQLAKENNCIAGIDPQRASELIDVDALDDVIRKCYPSDDLVIFEGHVGHLLKSMDKVIVLRCHPTELRKRLFKKQWNEKKIQENVDAETLDVILSCAVEYHLGKNIFEIDTSKKTIDAVAKDILTIIQKKFQSIKHYRLGQIDWSEEILKKPQS
jgi:adenylate kinase